MDVSKTRKIVILGKTGAGKSSLANTIFGEELFKTSDTFDSETRKYQAETRSVNGRSITLIDIPGFFDTERSEEDLQREIVRCITECAPGPHAFLIVLKVERYTVHEKAVIDKIREYFSDEALKYATVVFTHGDQLKEKQTIEDLVRQNERVSDLVNKCGGRCHVIDNKYWNNNQHEYRNNQFQVQELLNTIDKIIEANKGDCYTNEMLQTVKREIQQEEEHIAQSSGDMSEEAVKEKAKVSIFQKLLIKLAGMATGALLGALFGVAVYVGVFQTMLGHNIANIAPGEAGILGVAAVSAAMGSVTGYSATEGEDTIQGAAKRAAEDATNAALSVIDKACDVSKRLQQSKLKQGQGPNQ